MVVNVYNSAGELVKQLFSGSSQVLPNGFTLSAPSLVQGGAGVSLTFTGQLQNGGSSLIWLGTNDAGQPVSGGNYTIQVQSTNPFGQTQSWTKSVVVFPQTASQALNIYNSAGELVATLNTSTFTTQSITTIGFGTNTKAAFVLGSGGGVPFVMQDAQGKPVTYTWTGTSNSGATVAPGTYMVQLVSNTNGVVVMQSKEFEVLGDMSQPAFDAVAGPNPVGAFDKQLVFVVSGIQSNESADVKLYNIAGELISQSVGAVGGGKVVLSIGNWSSGIYVAVVERLQGSSVISRKLLHIAMER